MAVPTYATDLVTITAAETITGFTALGGGASGLGTGADLAMQGPLCVDKAVSASEKGMMYDNGATITPGTSEHFYVWLSLGTPGLADTLVNRGITVAIGTSITAYNKFHVAGNDTLGATARVGRCYPIRYVTTSSGSVPYRTLVGTPGANPQWFGGLSNITGTAKGSNFGVDAIRRGTGIFITAGEIASPGTFTGAQTQNDNISNRWGIFTGATSSIFELQGRFAVGRNSSGTPTQAYFNDSNKNILILDTPHSQTDLTQFIVDQSSTECYLTGITFEALGTNNKGLINVVNGKLDLTTCNFVNFGATTFNSLSFADGCVWRSCGTITQAESELTNCSFVNTLVLANNLTDISGCSFISDGTGHGIEVTTAGTYSFNNNTFTSFGAGGTTDAAIYNNSGGLVTINISGGDTPTIRNGAGASTVVNNTVTVTITALDADTLSPIPNARVRIITTTGNNLVLEGATNGSGVLTGGTSYIEAVKGYVRRATVADGQLYKSYTISATITGSGLSLTALMIKD